MHRKSSRNLTPSLSTQVIAVPSPAQGSKGSDCTHPQEILRKQFGAWPRWREFSSRSEFFSRPWVFWVFYSNHLPKSFPHCTCSGDETGRRLRVGTEATGFGCSLISLITVSPQQDNALVLAAMRESGGRGGETLVVITLLPQTFMEHIACSRDSQGWGYKAAGATRLQSSEGNRQTHRFQYSWAGSLRKSNGHC